MKFAGSLSVVLLTAACSRPPAVPAVPLAAAYQSPDPQRQEEQLPQVAPLEPQPEPDPIDAIEVATRTCPIGTRGVVVTVDPTADGAALIFEAVAEPDPLRTRLHSIAEIHNEMHARLGPLPGVDVLEGGEPRGERDEKVYASGGIHERRPGEVPPDETFFVLTHSRARVEPIADGARLTFTAAPEELQALRNELAQHATYLEQACAWGDEQAVPEPDGPL